VARRGLWKDVLRRRMLAVSDAVAVAGAGLVAGAVEGTVEETALWIVALLPVWLLLAKLLGLYDQDHRRIRHQTVDEIPGIFHWVTLAAAATVLAIQVTNSGLLGPRGAVALWVAAILGALAARAASRFAWRLLVPSERGLLVGGAELADSVARKLVLEPGHHLSLVRRVTLDSEPADLTAKPGSPKRRPVRIEELEQALGTGEYDRVIVGMQDLDEATLARIVACCREVGVKLSVAPPVRGMFGTVVQLSRIAELPLIEFRTWDPSRSTMAMKRMTDVTLAAVALIALAPLFLLIALLVKLDSRGPAIFRQRRAGLGGEPFTMFKFRTMINGADRGLQEVIRVEELADPMFKLRKDPRVTRVGRVLRRASLDELPQLWNVLRGDMSLVGPRPEESWLVDRYGPEARFRLEMRPGLTGPMQVHGRGELEWDERLAVEREYVDGYSLRRDFQILLQTLSAVGRGRGAF
jgi:exopolysaccharide biosynthesis polyprenyl glycosylphosphotransferase